MATKENPMKIDKIFPMVQTEMAGRSTSLTGYCGLYMVVTSASVLSLYVCQTNAMSTLSAVIWKMSQKKLWRLIERTTPLIGLLTVPECDIRARLIFHNNGTRDFATNPLTQRQMTICVEQFPQCEPSQVAHWWWCRVSTRRLVQPPNVDEAFAVPVL